jgi:transcription termination/antitermination protein NusG
VSKRWYVVHAYSGFEHQVEKNLKSRIERFAMQEKFGQVLVPTEEVVEMRSGQKRKFKPMMMRVFRASMMNAGI